MTLIIRPVTAADYEAWLPLWQGYQMFYQVALPAEVTAETWRRFLDPLVPVYALVAEQDGALLGLAHYLFHHTTWSIGPYCYLNDLFTSSAARGRGIGRALINAVADRAREAGAARYYWTTHETNLQAQALYNTLAATDGFLRYRMPLEPQA
jgi:GNAT superfamily N-acetyltransferase